MVFVKETPYSDVGKPILIVFLGYVVILAIFSMAAYSSSSPNLYLALAALFFILTTPLSALISFRRAMKAKEASKIILISSIIIILIGALILAYGAYLLWIALTIRPLIKRFEIALIAPIITIIGTYFVTEYLEKKVPELYWRLSRAVSDRVRGGVSASATAIIGPAIAFFGLINFDAYFAFLPLAYALIELKRSLDELRMTSRQKRNLESFNKHLEQVLKTIPNVIKIDRSVFDPANQFLIVYAKFYVPSFLEDEVISKMVDYATTYIVENFGVVLFVRIEVDKSEIEKIKVAVPVKDNSIINDDFDAPKYVIAEMDQEGKLLSKEIVELGNSSDKMRSVEKARELVKRGIMIVATKSVDDKAKRELKGWFTEVLTLDTKNIDEALKKIREFVIKK